MTDNQSVWRTAASEVKTLDEACAGGAVIALPWDDVHVDAIRSRQHSVFELASATQRALAPGSHVAMWTSGRAIDLAGLALRLAGFEIRDSIAAAHDGALSYWLVGRNTLVGGAVVPTVLKHGTGAINVDACRVEASGRPRLALDAKDTNSGVYVGRERGDESFQGGSKRMGTTDLGRFAPNVLLDAAAAAEVDRQAPDAGGAAPASGPTYSGESKSNSMAGKFNGMGDAPPTFHGDSGGASRFFPLVERDALGVVGTPWVDDLLRTPHLPFLIISRDGVSLTQSQEDYLSRR